MVHIRTQREIDLITASCQIVADTLDFISDDIKPGANLIDIDSKAESFIRSQGARPAFKGYMGFPATLCISVNDEVVHGIPTNRVLEEGQIVGIDCGAEKEGYYGDHAKTFAVGKISKDKRKLMDIKIFVETADDIRIIRRIKRDVNKRQRSLSSVINQYHSTN